MMRLLQVSGVCRRRLIRNKRHPSGCFVINASIQAFSLSLVEDALMHSGTAGSELSQPSIGLLHLSGY